MGCISLEPVSPGIKTLSSLLKFYQHLLRSLHCEKSCKISAQPPTLSCIESLDNMAKTIDCLCFRTVNDYADLFSNNPTAKNVYVLQAASKKFHCFEVKGALLRSTSVSLRFDHFLLNITAFTEFSVWLVV